MNLLVAAVALASSLQSATTLDECVDSWSVAQALDALNRQWFDLAPEDVALIWPTELQPDYLCTLERDKPCLSYETRHAVHLDDGAPACLAIFYWRARVETPTLHTIIVWTSTSDREEAFDVADQLVDALKIPDDAIATTRSESQETTRRYQWTMGDDGAPLEVSVLSVQADRKDAIWRNYIAFTRTRIISEDER